MHVGPFSINWRRQRPDPLWELFVNAAPSDPGNLVAEAVRVLPEGNIFPVKTDIHSPEIMSGHVKEFARFLGADLCGVVKLRTDGEADSYPFGVICAFAADYDLRKAEGIGGQAPVLNGAFVTFVLGAWIRECGYRATRTREPEAELLAAQAGLGRLDKDGRLINPRYGPHVYVADVLRTDLPLSADREATS